MSVTDDDYGECYYKYEWGRDRDKPRPRAPGYLHLDSPALMCYSYSTPVLCFVVDQFSFVQAT